MEANLIYVQLPAPDYKGAVNDRLKVEEGYESRMKENNFRGNLLREIVADAENVLNKSGTQNTASTPFSIAWNKYKESPEYARSVRILYANGMVQAYIDNVLFWAFAAGWKSK